MLAASGIGHPRDRTLLGDDGGLAITGRIRAMRSTAPGRGETWHLNDVVETPRAQSPVSDRDLIHLSSAPVNTANGAPPMRARRYRVSPPAGTRNCLACCAARGHRPTAQPRLATLWL